MCPPDRLKEILAKKRLGAHQGGAHQSGGAPRCRFSGRWSPEGQAFFAGGQHALFSCDKSRIRSKKRAACWASSLPSAFHHLRKEKKRLEDEYLHSPSFLEPSGHAKLFCGQSLIDSSGRMVGPGFDFEVPANHYPDP